MSYSYDASDLNTTSSSGRLNSTRLLIGDTDESDQQLQNEEITFALAQNGDNVYLSAAYCSRLLASKYARLVDTQLDGALEAKYSDRVAHYNLLYTQLIEFAKKVGGKGLGVFAGGISVISVEAVESNTDRVKPAFKVGQFDNPSDSDV